MEYTCKCCGKTIKSSDLPYATVNSGMKEEFIQCWPCHVSDMDAGRVFQCEACGEYFSSDVLHSEEINGESFCACPNCGCDIIEGTPRDEMAGTYAVKTNTANKNLPSMSAAEMLRASIIDAILGAWGGLGNHKFAATCHEGSQWMAYNLFDTVTNTSVIFTTTFHGFLEAIAERFAKTNQFSIIENKSVINLCHNMDVDGLSARMSIRTSRGSAKGPDAIVSIETPSKLDDDTKQWLLNNGFAPYNTDSWLLVFD